MKLKDILIAFLAALAFFSCIKNDLEPPRESVPPARIVSKTYDAENGMTVCRFEYPSSDPWGKPAVISGVITYGDEITYSNPSLGIMLLNRFTAIGRMDSPSGGFLAVQKAMLGSGLVCVSSDHYGFGSTLDKNQAYCMGDTNAQTSIDALLAARQLLPELGIKFALGKDRQVFNMGYSQGAQTAIGVLKVASEKYPDLRFTHTFVGGGPYDMRQTYCSMFEMEKAVMPATVIVPLISFNSLCNLGYSLEDLFQESALKDIKKYILSKDYPRTKLEDIFPPQPFSNFLKDDILDLDSQISKQFQDAFSKENLCKGWTPRKTEKIFLSSNPNDDVVPSINTKLLYSFLVEEQGLTNVNWYSSSGISVLIPDSVPRHTAAVADFIIRVVYILRSDYDIPWIPDITKLLDEAL